MNSLISEDLSRENLVLETAKCLQEIFTNTQRVNALHQEILEINLSITAYVEESRKNLEGLRLETANEAGSSQEVVTALSEKFQMSPPISTTNTAHKMMKTFQENNTSKLTERKQARSFITWFKHTIDNDRNNLGLYLSDDVVLEWFGRTIKNRKKVTAFLKFDIQCSRHNFTSVEKIDKVELRADRLQRTQDSILASPLNSPEIVMRERSGKRKLFQSCGSPEWAEGCEPVCEIKTEKVPKKDHLQFDVSLETQCNGRKRLFSEEETDVNGKGDGGLGRKSKRQCVQDSAITPPNKEVGQGDCLPSTSGTDSDRSHDALNAQLPRLAVECNGYIEFTRSRNSSDTLKWERKCKVQISYSEDPLNIGEYILWLLRYTDETKCRRNLLAAFEEAANESSHF